MKVNISEINVNKDELKKKSEELTKWHKLLMSDDLSHLGADRKGWATLPGSIDQALLDDIINTAEKVKEQCTLFIVIGIGGSYLGSRAVIEALNGSRDDYPEVTYAGFNMNGAYLKKLLKRITNESVCICAISKSGTTVEPLLSFSIIKEKLIAKYGEEEANRRIYVITDESDGTLRKEASEKGYKSFCIPRNIGGRYSVLSPVGLFPIAVAGHEIKAIISGARNMEYDDWSENGYYINYPASRVIRQNDGKFLEIFEYFEGNLFYFGEWLRQLFGESEGKNGLGAYPSSLFFSRDLHSIGQFLQQGRQIFTETVIRVKNSPGDELIPESAGMPYAGKTVEQINDCAERGVIAAHQNAGIPITDIHIDELNEYTIGQLIYFFEMSAALSAYSLGLNPFDQIGVEEYKAEMKKFVGNI